MAEVGMAELRQALKKWITRVQDGDEVIITERGKPVARLSAVGVPTALEQLAAEGHVLSGFDAVHLASALVLVGPETVVATWDARLHTATVGIGVMTLPASL